MPRHYSASEMLPRAQEFLFDTGCVCKELLSSTVTSGAVAAFTGVSSPLTSTGVKDWEEEQRPPSALQTFTSPLRCFQSTPRI